MIELMYCSFQATFLFIWDCNFLFVMEKDEKLLQYEAFISQIDVSFWHELCKKKLEQLKLSDEPITLQGQLSLYQSERCLFRIDGNSFEYFARLISLTSVVSREKATSRK